MKLGANVNKRDFPKIHFYDQDFVDIYDKNDGRCSREKRTAAHCLAVSAAGDIQWRRGSADGWIHEPDPAEDHRYDGSPFIPDGTADCAAASRGGAGAGCGVVYPARPARQP